MPIKAKVEQWEGAGITDEASGRVGSSVRVVPLWVPDNIRVEGDRLCWDSWGRRSPSASPSARQATPDAAMLTAFARIARAKNRASAIERFAKRYGVLGARETKPDAARFDYLRTWPGRIYQRWGFHNGRAAEEPLAAWNEMLEGVIALLNIGSGLALEKPRIGTAEDWAVADRDFDPQKGSLKEARLRLADLLNVFLAEGDARIQIGLAHAWDAARPSRWETYIRVGSSADARLFGALALQTMLAVAGIDLYCCTGCKLPYVRSRRDRRPKPNQNNYCNNCRNDGQPLRDAKTRYRRKEPK